MGNHDILFSFIFQIWRRSSRPPLTPPRLRRGSRWSWGVTRPGGSQGRRCIGQGEVFRTYLNYFSFWTMDIFKGIFSVVNIFLKNLSSLFQIRWGDFFSISSASACNLSRLSWSFFGDWTSLFFLIFPLLCTRSLCLFSKRKQSKGTAWISLLFSVQSVFYQKARCSNFNFFSALHLLSRILSNTKCLNLEGGNWEGRSPCLCTVVVDPFSRQGFIYGKREWCTSLVKKRRRGNWVLCCSENKQGRSLFTLRQRSYPGCKKGEC